MGFGAGASRAERKAKRRKLENSIPDIPDDLEQESNDESVSTKRKRALDDDADEEEQSTPLEGKDEITKKNKETHHKSKKTKTAAPIEEASDMADTEAAPKKSKKERKAERKAREAAANTASTTHEAGTAAKQDDPHTAAAGESDQTPVQKKRAKGKQQRGLSGGPAEESKAARFIVFVGNLPFTATTAAIQKHFAAVKPASVRHLTEKGNPSKSRGCAFLEFAGYDHMKTCLEQFHHTTFDDGLSAARKVNVELTAGGGGNTRDRRSKIKGKNEKLNEQRVRRAQEAGHPKGSKSKAVEVPRVLAEDSGIHPSRRARIGG